MKLLIAYSAALALISLITLILYAVDKKRAKKGEWRIPEATLLCFSFFWRGNRRLFRYVCRSA